jgi:thiol-disulfide isomerase/thioredoxin
MRAWYFPLMLLTLAACSPAEQPVNTLNLDALRGQWVVINYWAIWCKPCIQEIPELNALAELPEVTVLGVNYDGTSGEELNQQLQKLGVAFPTLATDPSAQLGIARPVVLPTSLVLGPKGELRDTLIGPQTLETLAAATNQTLSGHEGD